MRDRRGGLLDRGLPAGSDALPAYDPRRGAGHGPARAQPGRSAHRRVRLLVAQARGTPAPSRLRESRRRSGADPRGGAPGDPVRGAQPARRASRAVRPDLLPERARVLLAGRRADGGAEPQGGAGAWRRAAVRLDGRPRAALGPAAGRSARAPDLPPARPASRSQAGSQAGPDPAPDRDSSPPLAAGGGARAGGAAPARFGAHRARREEAGGEGAQRSGGEGAGLRAGYPRARAPARAAGRAERGEHADARGAQADRKAARRRALARPRAAAGQLLP